MSRDTLFKASPRRFVCGTRAVHEWNDGSFHVHCATCAGGGTVKHKTLSDAAKACVRDSNKPCRACGAK